MNVLLYDAPAPVPLPTDLDPWTTCTHRWTDWTGKVWDLTGRDGDLSTSGVYLGPGLRGHDDPGPVQHYKRRSASVPGSVWRGSNTDEREVFWPVSVYQGDGSQAWLDYNRRWWRGFQHPEKTGVWSITQPGDGLTAGQTRSLTLRFTSRDQAGEDIASELLGWADYGLLLSAEQPYWAGSPIVQTWTQGAPPVNYYGGGPVDQPGFGPPFVTMDGRSLATATATNPGDLAVLPEWTAFGPTTQLALGVGTKTVIVPFALSPGQWFRMDTARTDRRALFGSGAVQVDGEWQIPPAALAAGVNRTRDLGSATKFGEVPAGESVPLSIAMTGSGTVRMKLSPLYYLGR